MTIYKKKSIEETLSKKTYPGRGIIVGLSPNGRYAISAYFIMGRSANSRNRVFDLEEDGLYTQAADPKKLEDPSLIIYRALAQEGKQLVVTNGDQTETILEGLKADGDWEKTLGERTFEPDGPNFTPRISAVMTLDPDHFHYDLSILKSVDEKGSDKVFYLFHYPAVPGLGHFISTYVDDGDPLPSFQGEPDRVDLADDYQDLAKRIWQALDEDNRISLYVRYTDLETGEVQDQVINKYRK